jgi:hypothetical protein
MRGLNVSEEFGVILLGLAVADLVKDSWILPMWIDGAEFGIVRWVLTLVLLMLIVGSLVITHRTNTIAATKNFRESGEASLVDMKKRPLLYILPAAIVIFVLVFALSQFGARQAFMIWAGIGFLNFGPWIEKWASRI